MAAEWRLVYLGLDRAEKMSQRMCLSWGFMEELGITRKMKKKRAFQRGKNTWVIQTVLD